jgi:clan AA aspartic protease
MITGVVTPFYQATIRLSVRGPTGQAQEIEAVIDTGFDGALSLPPAAIAALGLPWRRRGRALLADGTTSLFDIYEATVLWDGAPRRVAVDAADIAPLVGMRLLDGYELTVQAIVGGQVLIKAREPAVDCRQHLPGLGGLSLGLPQTDTGLLHTSLPAEPRDPVFQRSTHVLCSQPTPGRRRRHGRRTAGHES